MLNNLRKSLHKHLNKCQLQDLNTFLLHPFLLLGPMLVQAQVEEEELRVSMKPHHSETLR
jgi:hypothetical protein